MRGYGWTTNVMKPPPAIGPLHDAPAGGTPAVATTQIETPGVRPTSRPSGEIDAADAGNTDHDTGTFVIAPPWNDTIAPSCLGRLTNSGSAGWMRTAGGDTCTKAWPRTRPSIDTFTSTTSPVVRGAEVKRPL